MSVLSQALSGAPLSYKLEFMVRSTAELSTVVEELRARAGGETLKPLTNRSCSNKCPVYICSVMDHGRLVKLWLSAFCPRKWSEVPVVSYLLISSK